MSASSAKRGGYAVLVQELAPGGRLVRARRLRGGLGARMDVVDIERADGTRDKVTLRRFIRDHRFCTPEHVAHEYRILQLVERAGIPSPRPLLLDAEGRFFGVPAIVMTYLPGRPLYTPRSIGPWAAQLTEALLSIHAVTPERVDLSWLSVNLRDGMRWELAKRREEMEEAPILAQEVHAVLESELDRIEWPAPTFVHDDYWPGNTIWQYGRLAGVIDWTASELGDPRADVSQCRADLALSHGIEVADAFLEAYQARAPRPLPDLWYFDLFRGLRALLYHELWLPGYHDLGLTHITPRLARQRIEGFLRRALEAGRKARIPVH